MESLRVPQIQIPLGKNRHKAIRRSTKLFWIGFEETPIDKMLQNPFVSSDRSYFVESLYGSGKALRLCEFIDPEDGKSVIIEADKGLMLGPIAGLVNLEEAVEKVKSEADAVVLSPGQVRQTIHHFRGKMAPALLIRADWTNVFRDEGFALPARKMRHVVVASTEDAVVLGASAIVAFFFVGYESDEDEARNMESMAKLARESDRLGVPLLVESIPIGERVTEVNYADCVDLAMRMSVEAGADAVAAPYTGDVKSFGKIVDAAKVPVFVLDIGDATKDILKVAKEALRAGASGVVASGKVFQAADPVQTLKALRDIVHRQKVERKGKNV